MTCPQREATEVHRGAIGLLSHRGELFIVRELCRRDSPLSMIVAQQDAAGELARSCIESTNLHFAKLIYERRRQTLALGWVGVRRCTLGSVSTFTRRVGLKGDGRYTLDRRVC